MASAFLAVSSAASFAPLNPSCRPNEFEFYLTDLRAKALIVQSAADSPAIAVARKHSIAIIELSPVAESDTDIFSIPSEKLPSVSQGGFAQADDVALILYTSGTTARPKMVPLTHSNLLASAGNIAATLQLTEKDRCLNVMPLFHIKTAGDGLPTASARLARDFTWEQSAKCLIKILEELHERHGKKF